MLDRHSVDLLNFPFENCEEKSDQLIVLLIKYFNKNSMEEDVDLHWLKKTQLEQQEYPGRAISKQVKFDKKNCKYFSVLKCGDSHLILFLLYDEFIHYELFKRTGGDQPFSSVRVDEIKIVKGNWDYMHTVFVENGK